MATMWSEFKAFIKRGNVLDMAVGITVGTAFTALVKSFVNDLLMPPISLLLGATDFTNAFALLKQGDPVGPYASLAAATEAGATTWRYGAFINSVVSFVLLALAVFFVVKAANRLMPKPKPAPPTAPTTTKCPYCLSDVPLAATRCAFCTSDLPAAGDREDSA